MVPNITGVVSYSVLMAVATQITEAGDDFSLCQSSLQKAISLSAGRPVVPFRFVFSKQLSRRCFERSVRSELQPLCRVLLVVQGVFFQAVAEIQRARGVSNAVEFANTWKLKEVSRREGPSAGTTPALNPR